MWVSIFYPYPGTKLHSLCLERGLIREDASGAMERRVAVLDLPGFSRKEIERAYVWFEYRVYRGVRPLMPLLVRALRKKLRLLYFALMVRPPRRPRDARSEAASQGSEGG